MKKTFFRRAFNRLLHQLARSVSGATSLRPFLHHLRGVRIHGAVFIGDEVYLENEYPESVEIQEGAIISLRTTIIAHTRGPGRVVIERNAFVGANCVIAAPPGKTLTVGEGSVLGIGSIVTADIPAFTFCTAERVKPIAKVTAPFTINTSYEEFMKGLRPLPRNGRSVSK